MEELLTSQHELFGRISRTWENLKKAGQQNITIDLVRATLTLLDAKWARLEEQHHTLMRAHRAALKDHDYVTENFLEAAEVQYMSQRAHLLSLERQYVANTAAEATAVQTPTTPASVPTGSAPAPSFPRIELPKFTGQFEDWPAFRDLFQSMVTDEASLSNVRKLHYLKTSVSGEAESLLKNLPVTEDNFKRAWASLKEHYENPRLLVRSYLNAFSALPKMRPNSMADLRRIFHGVMNTVGALEGIGRPITSSEDLFVHMIVNLLDQSTRREWDKTLRKSSKPPSFEELQSFLKEQTTSEEALAETRSDLENKTPLRHGRSVRVAQSRQGTVGQGRACPVCKGPHFLATCEQYLRKGPQGRRELVSSHNRCYNCLGRHSVNACSTTKNCLKCSGRHHTTLHETFSAASPTTVGGASVLFTQQFTEELDRGYLATARVLVRDVFGREHRVRAVIDTGSEVTLVSEALAQRLRLPRASTSTGIFDVVGQHSGTARGRVSSSLSSLDGNSTLTLSSLVLPRLSVQCGAHSVKRDEWAHLRHLHLADPEFDSTDPVELLLGMHVYASIVMSGVRRGRKLEPVAQQTRLGWILLWKFNNDQAVSVVPSLHCTLNEDLTSALRRFWEWEEPSMVAVPATDEEIRCERFFLETHKRLPDRRFQVRLPLRTLPSPQLALTKHAATRMLDAMKRRFARDAGFRALYTDFMAEYNRLEHVTLATHAPLPEEGQLCYLPHHGVLKRTDGKSKLRVVFNGSSLAPTGISLNSCLFSGPNLIPSLPDIILRWRRHQFAFVTDIEKMYRQILVHSDDRDLQRILWEHNGTTKEFRLNTVTYGTACAPYLAVRVLRQLAEGEDKKFPAGASALRHDVYVDDILSGASTIATGRQLQEELTALCMAGGFPLKKWAANHEELLQGIPASHRQASSATAELPYEEHSVLGVHWSPLKDCFTLIVTTSPFLTPTRKAVLSQTARLFDPLGWLAPVIVTAKLLVQSTWLQQLDWDAPLATPEATIWTQLRKELPEIGNIKIPRWLTGFAEDSSIEVHGFADASERAYAAVIYLRIVQKGRVAVSLVQAKTRVAPLKRVSLPRLELCAAALLAKTSSHVREVLGLVTAPTFHWSDSTVALAWIRGHPSKWTTFVANRVAEIQLDSHSVRWLHVPGSTNPADCASRGMLPSDLAAHTIWWQGPPFLQEDSSTWPDDSEQVPADNLPEQRPIKCLAAKQEVIEPPELTRFSSLRRLLRVTSWMCRWRSRKQMEQSPLTLGDAVTSHPQELEAALALWVRKTQAIAFDQELTDIRAGRAVHSRSKLKKLTPFLGEDGILRVGGRLKHALLHDDQKHPVILPPNSHLSQLIIDAHHRRTLHGGTQATLASIRQRFWLPRGRQRVKGVIHACRACIRWRASTPQPIMGNLPAARVNPSRPFLHTGVDYAGLIRIRTSKGQGQRSYKGFICIFVCFSTRAVHLEAVSDYTATAFLAAFRRFTSRRGICSVMYSDRGTNSVGADRELRALFSGAAPGAKRIASHLTDEGIRWSFNPPAAPHFGSIWEAAVRSVKHHLRRVIGDHTLTFEELATLLAEVEACLNSRPLQALTDDPDDTSALTPGHFLIGEPLTSIPEPSLLEVAQNRLTRWRLLQAMRDHLWARWSQEYMQSLIPRPKWWKTSGGLKEGQLCLIKDDNTSPTRWPLARVTQLHPGSDHQVRVVELRTASGTFTRPVTKLVPLPSSSASTD